ncbi:MAG: hypothetical protein ACRD1N_06115, partial [Terriglobia bacterium]
MNRRRWLASLGGLLAASSVPESSSAEAGRPQQSPAKAGEITLSEFQPKSMLRVAETNVPRARFPVVDVHTHLSWT